MLSLLHNLSKRPVLSRSILQLNCLNQIIHIHSILGLHINRVIFSLPALSRQEVLQLLEFIECESTLECLVQFTGLEEFSHELTQVELSQKAQ